MEDNRSLRLEITGISPVFIGSGDLYSQLDYIVEDQKVHLLNFNSLLGAIPLNLIDDLTKNILDNFRNNRWEGDVKSFLEEYDLDWKKHVKQTHDLIGEISKNELHQFIKTSDRLYIPGSSVKGAIRTSVLFSLLKNNPTIRDREESNVLRYFKDRNIQELIRTSAKDDLLRALIVSDLHLSDPKNNTQIVESSVYHLENKEFTIPIFYEVLDKGFHGSGSIKIDKNLIESDFLKAQYFDLNASSLVEAVNDFSQRIITHELKTLQSQKDDNLSQIVSFYSSLDHQLKNLGKNECVLRLGQGSSVLAVTLFLNFQDNKRIVQKYRNLETIRFNTPDRRNRGFAIATKGGKTYLIDRNPRYRPRLNETWLCSIQPKGRTVYVKLLEKMDASQQFLAQELLYPLTRKLIFNQKHQLSFPFGWVKLSIN